MKTYNAISKHGSKVPQKSLLSSDCQAKKEVCVADVKTGLHQLNKEEAEKPLILWGQEAEIPQEPEMKCGDSSLALVMAP